MKKPRHIIIAVDGYSSCGKSTIAKDLARELGITYVDTGAMYRAVTLAGIERGLITNGEIDQAAIVQILGEIELEFRKNDDTQETWLNGKNVDEEIRSMEVSNIVSPLSLIPEIRYMLVDIQREMGQHTSLVMDGRDIGTVVFPAADVKVFMTASVDVRAQRRYDEMQEKGIEISIEEVKQNLEERDHRDSTRDISPLRQADDADVLDNSDMTINEQLEWIKKLVNEKISHD